MRISFINYATNIALLITFIFIMLNILSWLLWKLKEKNIIFLHMGKIHRIAETVVNFEIKEIHSEFLSLSNRECGWKGG